MRQPEYSKSTDEVARFLRVARSAVRRMCQRRELPSIRLGCEWRIRDDFMDVLVKNTEKKYPKKEDL